MWFLNRSETIQAVQAQETAKSWKFGIVKCTFHVGKTKALISLQLLFSHMQNVGISHDVAHLFVLLLASHGTFFFCQNGSEAKLPQFFTSTI